MATIKIYGASDDCVELSGAIHEEIGSYDQPTFLRFANGLHVKAYYNSDGIWKIEIIDQGACTIVNHGYGVEEDGGEEPHSDPDAPTYSDVLVVSSGNHFRPFEVSHHPLPEFTGERAAALLLIEAIKGGKRGDLHEVFNDADAHDQHLVDELADAIKRAGLRTS